MNFLKFSHVLVFSLFFAVTICKAQDSAQIQLTPEEVTAYIESAKTGIANGSFEPVIADLTKVIDFDNHNYEALNLRGNAKVKLEDQNNPDGKKNYTEALEDYTNALYAIDKQLESAKENRELKISLRQYRATICINRGVAKMNLGESKYYKLALEDFDEAFKLDRDNWDIYIYRSEVYRKLEDYSKEVFDLRRLLTEMDNPTSQLRTKLDIAELNYKMGRAIISDNNDKDQACKHYKKALDLGYLEAEKGVKRHCKF